MQKDVPIYQEWVGTTEGNVTAQIRARVQGYLQGRKYEEGTLVHAGDLLFEIDARPYQAALDGAKGDLGRAEALLTKAEQDVRRYTPLAAQQAISQEELDNATQASRAAKAAVDSGRAAVEKAKLNLDWTQVRSPIDGIAGIGVAQVGDLVSESTLLTTVSQVDPIKVSVSLSEPEYLKYADRISLNGARAPGASISGKVGESNLELVLADGNVFAERGRASVANREVDVRTGTLTVIALFPNPTSLVRPGQYAKVRATLETKKGALLVPQRAVQELQGSYQVAVVDAGSKVAIRPIKVGPRVGDAWLVEEGLKPGERVVVEGLQRVRDGVAVAVKAAEPVASAEAKTSH